jgi:ribosomal-protein-alanine N-acetyltransferase
MFSRFRRPRPSTIRPLRVEAAEACAAIHQSGFAHPWSASEFAEVIASPTTLASAALDPATGKLRGFALSRLAADEAEVLTIAVDPALRGRGVGVDLLREHLTRATLSGARAIFLEVDPDNGAAIALYRRFGFRDVGRREGYYRLKDGQSASAVVMRRDLA